MRRPAIALTILTIVVGLLLIPGDRRASAAILSGTLDQRISTVQAGMQAAALTGSQPWVTILCKFQDVPGEPHPLVYFQGLFANTYPGLDHYWREVSYNTISLAGSTAVGWLTLPRPKSYYVYDSNGDSQVEHDYRRTATDCTAAADPAVNFAGYYGINLLLNDDVNEPSIGGTLSSQLTLDGKTDFWPMTWIPKSYISQGVIAHEIGHTFGLGHIFVEDSFEISGWDLMGAPCYYGSQRDPVYGCVGLHINAVSKDRLGWMPAAQTVNATLGNTVTITLEQLALPQTGNARLVRIPINGSPDLYYSVEARRKTGYDNAPATPGSAVLIHQVRVLTFSSGQQIPIVELIAADRATEPGGSGAMWKPGMTFVDTINRITVSVISETASGFVVRIVNLGSKYRSYLPAARR